MYMYVHIYVFSIFGHVRISLHVGLYRHTSMHIDCIINYILRLQLNVEVDCGWIHEKFAQTGGTVSMGPSDILICAEYGNWCTVYVGEYSFWTDCSSLVILE
jgi:hypothetical protein